MAGEGDKPGERDWRPVPDPTVATTAQLLREIDALRAQIDIRLSGMDRAQDLAEAHLNRVPSDTDKLLTGLTDLIEEKFRSVETKITALSELQTLEFRSIQTQFEERDTRVEQSANNTRTAVDVAVASAAKVQDEKFSSIQQQFRERDIRAEQTFISSKVAVDAALQAAKEAVGEQNRSSALAIAKSENATDKRIDQIVALVSTATSALDGKIADIKDRLVGLEGVARGSAATKGEQHTSGGMTATVILTIVAVISLMVTAFVAFRH